jgi:hypothetical protein
MLLQSPYNIITNGTFGGSSTLVIRNTGTHKSPRIIVENVK